MAQIVDLNDLVPEDIIVRYGKPPTDYLLPGDMDVESVFRLFEMFRALNVTEGDDQEVFDQIRGKFGDINAELLKLFQVRNPTLAELPFGIRGTGAMLRVVLGQLGLEIKEDVADPSPPTPKTKRAAGAAGRSR